MGRLIILVFLTGLTLQLLRTSKGVETSEPTIKHAARRAHGHHHPDRRDEEVHKYKPTKRTAAFIKTTVFAQTNPSVTPPKNYWHISPQDTTVNVSTHAPTSTSAAEKNTAGQKTTAFPPTTTTNNAFRITTSAPTETATLTITTLRALTEPKITLQFKLTQTFTDDLNNASSPQFKELETQVTSVLNNVFSEKYGFIFNQTIVTGFSPGSVVVNIGIVFKDINSVPEADNVTSTLSEAASSPNFNLSLNTSSIVSTAITAPTGSPTATEITTPSENDGPTASSTGKPTHAQKTKTTADTIAVQTSIPTAKPTDGTIKQSERRAHKYHHPDRRHKEMHKYKHAKRKITAVIKTTVLAQTEKAGPTAFLTRKPTHAPKAKTTADPTNAQTSTSTAPSTAKITYGTIKHTNRRAHKYHHPDRRHKIMQKYKHAKRKKAAVLKTVLSQTSTSRAPTKKHVSSEATKVNLSKNYPTLTTAISSIAKQIAISIAVDTVAQISTLTTEPTATLTSAPAADALTTLDVPTPTPYPAPTAASTAPPISTKNVTTTPTQTATPTTVPPTTDATATQRAAPITAPPTSSTATPTTVTVTATPKAASTAAPTNYTTAASSANPYTAASTSCSTAVQKNTTSTITVETQFTAIRLGVINLDIDTSTISTSDFTAATTATTSANPTTSGSLPRSTSLAASSVTLMLMIYMFVNL